MERDIIIAAIVRGETDYLREWITYHLNIGFNHIILGDNNDEGETKYDDIIKEFGNAISLVDLRGKEAVQKPFYNWVIKNVPYVWCAFIDADEFITFATDRFCNMRDFLSHNPYANAYKLNWKLYGDNNQVTKTEGGVIERFPNPLPEDFKYKYDFPENYHVKSILNKSIECKFIDNPHTVNGCDDYFQPNGDFIGNDSPFNKNMDYSTLYIRHYYTKSLEEWVNNKMGRRYADYKKSDSVVYYPLSQFFTYNEYNEEKANWLKEHGIEYEHKS